MKWWAIISNYVIHPTSNRPFATEKLEDFSDRIPALIAIEEKERS
jgi:hypothetical protein